MQLIKVKLAGWSPQQYKQLRLHELKKMHWKYRRNPVRRCAFKNGPQTIDGFLMQVFGGRFVINITKAKRVTR